MKMMFYSYSVQKSIQFIRFAMMFILIYSIFVIPRAYSIHWVYFLLNWISYNRATLSAIECGGHVSENIANNFNMAKSIFRILIY